MPLDVTENLSLDQFADMYSKFALPAASRHMKITQANSKAIGKFRIKFSLDSNPPPIHSTVNVQMVPDKTFIRVFGECLSTYFILEQIEKNHLHDSQIDSKMIAAIGDGLAPHLFAVADLAGTGTQVAYTYHYHDQPPSKVARKVLANKPRLWIRLASLDKWLEVEYIPHEGYLDVKH